MATGSTILGAVLLPRRFIALIPQSRTPAISAVGRAQWEQKKGRVALDGTRGKSLGISSTSDSFMGL